MLTIQRESNLSAEDFCALAFAAWGVELDESSMAAALLKTINISARCDRLLVGTARILTDGYLFGTVPEVMVHPDHRGRGVARGLMETLWEESPTGLFFGAQEGLEGFYESLGYERSLTSFQKRKKRSS